MNLFQKNIKDESFICLESLFKSVPQRKEVLLVPGGPVNHFFQKKYKVSATITAKMCRLNGLPELFFLRSMPPHDHLICIEPTFRPSCDVKGVAIAVRVFALEMQSASDLYSQYRVSLCLTFIRSPLLQDSP